MMPGSIESLPVAPSLLGESPFWHPQEAALYWCDIPGRRLHRWHPGRSEHRQWDFECEPGCVAPVLGGDLMLAMRDGIWRFDPTSGQRVPVCEAPYDPATERFNDGKADPQGRMWAGTIFEPRTVPQAALYRCSGTKLDRVAGDVTVSNGLAWSTDGRTMYWSDTSAHQVRAFDFDPADGSLSNGRLFAQFPVKVQGQDLSAYAGRPDGAAVDAEGHYWCAMYEGQQLLKFAPDGRQVQALPLPVRCPTMPCFGGDDLRTLFITTARDHRPESELATQPLAGCVLSLRVDVPGLPVNFVRP